jgi:hypothetical protein
MTDNRDPSKRFGIVATTVYDGGFVDAYFDHFASLGCLEQVRFYVVGDLTTPASCRGRVEKYRACGLPWQYLGVCEQEEFLRPFPALSEQIPWRSDNRRNVGFLMAYHDQCEIIVAIDDDNFPKPAWPFLEGHAAVGQVAVLSTAVGHGGWFNLCSMMEVECPSLGAGHTVYARGFPYQRRCLKSSEIGTSTTGRVAVNAGLWSGDPDVDAATRMVTRCQARENFSNSYLLGPGTVMPINTQNTAILREALPAYYYVKMGHAVGGMKLDRFGDIFSGFFLQKCVQAVGDCIRVGSPVVEHRRSPHNLYKDLWNELAGMVVIDDMLPLLEASLPAVADYPTATLQLADRLEEWSCRQSGFLWDDGLKGYFNAVAGNLRLWTSTLAQL